MSTHVFRDSSCCVHLIVNLRQNIVRQSLQMENNSSFVALQSFIVPIYQSNFIQCDSSSAARTERAYGARLLQM